MTLLAFLGGALAMSAAIIGAMLFGEAVQRGAGKPDEDDDELRDSAARPRVFAWLERGPLN